MKAGKKSGQSETRVTRAYRYSVPWWAELSPASEDQVTRLRLMDQALRDELTVFDRERTLAYLSASPECARLSDALVLAQEDYDTARTALLDEKRRSGLRTASPEAVAVLETAKKNRGETRADLSAAQREARATVPGLKEQLTGLRNAHRARQIAIRKEHVAAGLNPYSGTERLREIQTAEERVIALRTQGQRAALRELEDSDCAYIFWQDAASYRAGPAQLAKGLGNAVKLTADGRHGKLTLQVRAMNAPDGPAYQELPVTYHRPLPEDSQLRSVRIVRRPLPAPQTMRGKMVTHRLWVVFTVTLPAVPRPESSASIYLDITPSYRADAGEILVASIGAAGTVLPPIPAELLPRVPYLHRKGDGRKVMRGHNGILVFAYGGQDGPARYEIVLPEQMRSQFGKVNSLLGLARKEEDAGNSSHALHLRQYGRNVDENLRQRRKHCYRLIAAWLDSSGAEITFGGKTPKTRRELHAPSEAAATARRTERTTLRLAAVHELKTALLNKGAKEEE